ncbi:MAG: hypothetical protein ABSE62_04905 [Chthoniobacteraceae bacterium]
MQVDQSHRQAANASVDAGAGDSEARIAADAVGYLRNQGALTTPAAGPSRGPDGKQLAPETFVRWVIPGVWEDTKGAHHVDVPEMLRLFQVEDTPANREMCTRDMERILKRNPKARVKVRR